MEDTAVTETVENQTVSKETDPFALDESSLASLSPEQRASLDPIIESWKKKATDEISTREKTYSEKYKPLEEKALALDKLTQYAPFVQWWTSQQQSAQQGTSYQQAQAIGQAKPQDIATPEEWQDALYEISQGNPRKLNDLQARMMASWATPFVQKTTEEINNLKVEREIEKIFSNHPDAKELDQIGLDDKKQGTSILEFALDWAENNRRPLEEGYQMARRWADSLKVGAQQAAMGMVQGKKEGIITSQSTAQNDHNSVEVEDMNELLQKSLESAMNGDKNTHYSIRRK